MAEPVSTLATALQIAEAAAGLSGRIIRFVRDLREVDGTTTELFAKLDHLRGVVGTIESLMRRREAQSLKPPSDDELKALNTTKSLLKSCTKDIDAFTTLLTPLKPSRRGSGVHRLASQAVAQAKFDWKEKHISRLEERMQGNIILLQTLSNCSEVAIQGDAVYRLAGSNDNIARSQAKMQEDIMKLRSAIERLNQSRSQISHAQRGPLPTSEDPEEVDLEEDILGRMKAAIEVTESLCDKVSSMGSASDNESYRPGPQKGSSNTSVVEADSERNRLMLAQTRIDTPDTPQSSFATADSVLNDVPITRLGSPDVQDIDLSDDGRRLKPAASTHALPLTVMNNMLENYKSQARRNTEGPFPQYEDAERNWLRSLEWGTKREQAHDVPFEERFNIVIELAKAQTGQGKFITSEATLETLRRSFDKDDDKFAIWSCTSAKLYQQWFSKAQDIRILSKLEQFATDAYSVASQPMSSNPPAREQNLLDAAEALIAFFAWSADDVAVKTMCQLHPTATVPADYVAAQDVPGGSQAPSEMPSSRARESISGILKPGVLDTSRTLSNTAESSLGRAVTAPAAGENLLLSAARTKSVELVRYHVKGEDINSRDQRQRTALHLALLGAGGKDVVRILLENGADTNAADASRTTPLHICSELDKYELADELIQHGANVDTANNSGETPLQLAVRRRRLRMVQCLLNHGASVEGIGKHSGSKEIDFLIQEHLEKLRKAPSRTGTFGRFLTKR